MVTSKRNVLPIVSALLLSSVVLAQESPPPAATPAAPESAGRAVAAEIDRPNADPLAAERKALERVALEYDRQIQALQELGLQAKGMELADLHRRIEDLKTRHAAEALQVRLRVARETGNERRLKQLEQLVEELSRPRPTPKQTREVRPGGAESAQGDDR